MHCRPSSAKERMGIVPEIHLAHRITTFSGDLSSMTAPPFILSPVSLTEFPVFYGEWPSNHTTLLVEQVSHHPPITAYRIENKAKSIVLQGHNAQKTSFSSGSIIVRQIGHAVLTITLPSGEKEEYLITLPKLRIDGLWYGSPYIELAETSYIQSSTGWLSTIEYKGKGYFSGKSHSFKATVKPPTSQHKTEIIEGTWHTTSKTANGIVFHDVTPPKSEVIVKPLEEQSEWESRKLWGAVAKGIREGDFETASREKTRIENEQRQRRKDEAAAAQPWQLKHFKQIPSDPVYERLGKAFNANPATEDAYVFLDNAPF
ncbi:hypothetical protein HWV62_44109 [Athelia sp. TMB]|nr:hypothetical protein HWV62_44109 [Athelia sp. TMB]